VRADTLRLERYYALPGTDPRGRSATASGAAADEVVAGYRSLFEDAVRLRLHADVPVGTCLSGGLDSSSIVSESRRQVLANATLAREVGDHIKTFSAVYHSTEPYDEQAFIDVVAAATGADAHFTVPSIERLGGDVDRLVWHQDEPFGSLSIFAQWCVMSKVRDANVTVLLDGQGADEALAGYQPYVHHFADLLGRGRVVHAVREAQRASAIVGGGLVWPQFRVAAFAAVPAPVQQALRASRRRGRRADRAAPSDPFESAYDPGFVNRIAATGHAAPTWRPTTLTAHLRDSLTEGSLPHLLRYEDRNSMAFSVEARVPYVDYRLVEYACGPGQEYRIHNGWSKWLLRAAVADLLPPEIVWRRRKVGFEVPEADWIGRLLAMLPPDWHEPASRFIAGGAFSPEATATWMQRGLSRGLWRFVNVALWMKAFAAA